ncbi:MAG: PASTA domain-containing protein [Lachnospiraceae bacterium]|nr:PASTA domain-containing protein [Lachnospiraceae bacterium]
MKKSLNDEFEKSMSAEEQANFEEEIFPEDGGQDTGWKSKKEKFIIIGGAILALALAIAVFVVIFKTVDFGNIGSEGTETPMVDTEATEEAENTVEVPDVLGKSYLEAKEILNGLGLGIAFGENRESQEYEEGLIMAQQIEAGTKVEPNTTVKVNISSGNGLVVVPDAAGLTELELVGKLKTLGLVPSVKVDFSDTVEVGQVISTEPAAGEELAKGTEVWISVSKGPEIKLVTVPNVAGLTQAEAEVKLKQAGLKQGTIEEKVNNEVALGLVASQSVGAGVEVKEGTQVNLVISKGKYFVVADVVGLTRTEANTKLLAQYKELKWRDHVKFATEYTSHVAEGKVIRTEPAGGTVIDESAKDTIITVYISGGRGYRSVPNVTGMMFNEAYDTLSAKGFLYVTVEYTYTKASEWGRVVSQSTGRYYLDEKVKIVVSQGQNPATCNHWDGNGDGYCDTCLKSAYSQ